MTYQNDLIKHYENLIVFNKTKKHEIVKLLINDLINEIHENNINLKKLLN
jgi:hypothetical protein